MTEKKRYLPIAAIAAVALVAAACGGGGGTPAPEASTGTGTGTETEGLTQEEIAAEAALVAAAIGPGSVKLTDQPFGFDDDSGEFMTTEPADGSSDFSINEMYTPGSFEDSNGVEWHYSVLTRDPDMATREYVVRHTDQGPGTDQAYTVYYSTSDARDRDGVENADAAGVLELSMDQSDNHGLFSISFGITAPHQTIPIMHMTGETETSFDGEFNGIAGSFTCTGGSCSVVSDASGNLSTLNGDWTFTPTAAVADIMIAGVVPDPDYMNFGYWGKRTTAEDGVVSVQLLAFAEGKSDYDSVASVEGSARYSGPAIGQYMTKRFDPATGDPIGTGFGHFNAWTQLMAHFGGSDVVSGDQFSISGTVGYFVALDGNPIADADGDGTSDWTVMLMRGDDAGTNDATNIVEGDGTFGGPTTGDGRWDGTFHGAPYDANDSPRPTSASGIFDAHFNNGHVYGAFGTNLESN